MIPGRYRLFRAGIIAVILSLALVGHGTATMSAPMNGRDLTGTNLNNGWIAFNGDSQACAAWCDSTAECKGVVYVGPNMGQGHEAHCWMKSEVTGDVEQLSCVSFLKTTYYKPVYCGGSTADFTVSATQGASPLTVSFTDTSADAKQWAWDFENDGTTDSTAQNPPSHTYTNSLASVNLHKTVKLTTTDSCGKEHSKTATITVEPEAPAVTYGTLNIASSPSGATVYVDETAEGFTPLTGLSLSAGPHNVRLTLDGYNEYTTPFTIVAGNPTSLSIPLTKSTAGTGSIQITSTPDGAAITLEGGSQGTTPKTIQGLSAGSYTVGLTKSGYTYFQTTVHVSEGATTPLNVNLVKSTGPTTETTSVSSGTIYVSSIPAGASVNLDGSDKGTTPATIGQVKAGSHTLKLSLAGYKDKTLTVPVEAGKTTTVTAPLELSGSSPSAGYGNITIRSAPAGANVYLDGQKAGMTPIMLQGVAAGTHNLLLTMQGYSDVSQTVEVAAGSEKEILIDLGKKAPGFALPVSLAALAAIVLLAGRKRGGQ